MSGVSVIEIITPGPQGPRPNHQWDGTSIRFQKGDGSWGEWYDVAQDGGVLQVKNFLAEFTSEQDKQAVVENLGLNTIDGGTF